MKKLVFLIVLCFIFNLIFSETIEEFNDRNNFTLVSYNKCKIEQVDNEQIISIFKIKNSNEYRAIYFKLDNNKIVFYKVIEMFHHYFTTSAFDKKIDNGKLVILEDLDGDSLDEIILDYGAEKIFPLVLKYSNNNFEEILTISEYPKSNVLLPGAPDVFETWNLISYKTGELHLRRLQSDLVQYVTFIWDAKQKQFIEKNDFSYFENTGFITSDNKDFYNIQKELDNSYLEQLSSKQLRLLRNAIYAKYGRKFSNWDLVDNFLQCKWYSVNPRFSEALLSETDMQNINKIKNVEQKKGIYKPINWELKFVDN